MKVRNVSQKSKVSLPTDRYGSLKKNINHIAT
jgi:hypothetical protein